MRLITWQQPFWSDLSDFEKIRHGVNQLFSSYGSNLEGTTDLFESSWRPALDLYESKDDIFVRVDLPGVEKDKIDISVEGGLLTIRGEKKEEEVSQGELIRSERYDGIFLRTATLPKEVDTNHIQATYKNGVLELRLPKKEEAKPKQIKVQVE